MSEILESEKTVGAILANSSFAGVSPTNEVSYSWGDQLELHQWIIAKDKEISGMRAFGKENKSKYPLIWMVHPIEGKIQFDGNLFEGIQFVIACSTKAEWLNLTREHETMPTLTKIANHFLEILDTNKNASIIKTDGVRNVKFRKIYNYQEATPEKYRTVDNGNHSLDIWDAIVLRFDLKINNNCLNKTNNGNCYK